jgi:hypothetical protein
VYKDWGWALSYLKKFGSVTVLDGHIHQVMQKLRATSRSTPRVRLPSRSGRPELPGPLAR